MSFDHVPDRPVKSQFYLRLITDEPISKKEIKNFYNLILNNSPENVLDSFLVKDKNDRPIYVPLVHRINKDKKHEYEIPLTRNLTPNEILKIVNNLDYYLNINNFLLDTSTFDEDCCPNEDHSDLAIEEKIIESLARKFSERQHQQWMNDRINKGWRYGPKRSDKEKTHPLLKPWNQLAEEYKIIDYKLPKLFLDLLAEYGYTIISNNELDSLINKAGKKYGKFNY